MTRELDQKVQELLGSIELLLVDALKLSEESCPDIFSRRNRIKQTLYDLFKEHTRETRQQAQQDIIKIISNIGQNQPYR